MSTRARKARREAERARRADDAELAARAAKAGANLPVQEHGGQGGGLQTGRPAELVRMAAAISDGRFPLDRMDLAIVAKDAMDLVKTSKSRRMRARADDLIIKMARHNLQVDKAHFMPGETPTQPQAVQQTNVEIHGDVNVQQNNEATASPELTPEQRAAALARIAAEYGGVVERNGDHAG